MPRLGFRSVILCVALTLSLVALPVLAAVTYPCNFWGFASVDGVPVAAGTNISAWVAGENIGWALTGEGILDDDEFSMGADYDEESGYVVSFKIGDLWAGETAPWQRYGSVPVDLTASSQPATLNLVEGCNTIAYPGATAALYEALTNIGPEGLDVAVIIWARATWTNAQWWYYNVEQGYAWPAEFTHLENGRAYVVAVSEDCTWELL
jgi:hypothetical protein